VWYHFFISKGVGDVFFAMLITDQLAPAIVSAGMFLLILMLMYTLMRRVTGDLLVSMMVMTLITSAFIYTWDKTLFGPWGDFAKQHLTTGGLYLGCVWACWMQMHVGNRRGWALLTAAAYMGLALMRPQFIFMMTISIAVIAGLAVARRRTDALLPYVGVGLAGIAVSAAVHVLNYLMTGLGEVTPFRLFWRFADQEKLSHWISPFLGLELELGSSPEMGGLHMPDFHTYALGDLIYIIFKLNYLSDFLLLHGLPIAFVLVVGFVLLCLGRLPKLPAAFWDGVAVMLSITVATAAAFLTLNQVVSMFRFTVFSVFVVMTLPTLVLFTVRCLVRRHRVLYAAVGLAGSLVAAASVHANIKQVDSNQIRQQFSYAGGFFTIADAYDAQGYLWRPGRAMCEHRPADADIWYMTVLSDAVVMPHCEVDTFFSFAMGKDWHRILFEPPEVARAILQKMNLNYFMFNNPVATFDVLPFAPLFKPETMDKYFSIVWTDGSAYLLTWKEQRAEPPKDQAQPPKRKRGRKRAVKIAPPSAEAQQMAIFIEQYKKSVLKGQERADFADMYRQLGDIYRDFKANGSHWPVKVNPAVPHPRGWQ
jgi:hypothetical protein